MKPLFSILVAQYNNGKYFQELYDSLLKQSYSNWECIIVDDKSTDNSLGLINSIIKKDKRFKVYLNEENKGTGYTKMRCAELANGDICGFVDPDDTITPNALDVMVKNHIELDTHSLIYSKHMKCDHNMKPLTESTYVRDLNEGETLIDKVVVSHFATFKLDFYKKTSGINPFFLRAVDHDLYLKLEEVGEIKFIDMLLYNYRIHKGGISTYENKYKANFWHWCAMYEAVNRRNMSPNKLEQNFNLYIKNIIRENKNKNIVKVVINKLLRILDKKIIK